MNPSITLFDSTSGARLTGQATNLTLSWFLDSVLTLNGSAVEVDATNAPGEYSLSGGIGGTNLLGGVGVLTGYSSVANQEFAPRLVPLSLFAQDGVVPLSFPMRRDDGYPMAVDVTKSGAEGFGDGTLRLFWDGTQYVGSDTATSDGTTIRWVLSVSGGNWSLTMYYTDGSVFAGPGTVTTSTDPTTKLVTFTGSGFTGITFGTHYQAAAGIGSNLRAVNGYMSSGSNVPTVTPTYTGSGAFAVDLSPKSGTNSIGNVEIRVLDSGGVLKARGNNGTNAALQVNLNADNYLIAASKGGYSFNGATQTVVGDMTGTNGVTLSLSPVSVTPPADPALTTGYLTTYDGQGNLDGGVTLQFQCIQGPGTAGYSFDSAPFNATSSTNLASLGQLTVQLLKSSTYHVARGGKKITNFQTGTNGTVPIDETLGTP